MRIGTSTAARGWPHPAAPRTPCAGAMTQPPRVADAAFVVRSSPCAGASDRPADLPQRMNMQVSADNRHYVRFAMLRPAAMRTMRAPLYAGSLTCSFAIKRRGRHASRRMTMQARPPVETIRGTEHGGSHTSAGLCRPAIAEHSARTSISPGGTRAL